MGSSGKPKTTYAKLQREAVLRERRIEKAARKQARKDAPPDTGQALELEPDTLEGAPDPATSESAS
jgi:hypothetical protein